MGFKYPIRILKEEKERLYKKINELPEEMARETMIYKWIAYVEEAIELLGMLDNLKILIQKERKR